MIISEELGQRWKAGELVTVGVLCVFSHGYGGMVRSRDGGGGWYAFGTKPGGLVACWEMSEQFLSAR